MCRKKIIRRGGLPEVTSERNNSTHTTQSSTMFPTLEHITAQIQRDIPQITLVGAQKLAEIARKELLKINTAEVALRAAKPHVYIREGTQNFAEPNIKVDGMEIKLERYPQFFEVYIQYVVPEK